MPVIVHGSKEKTKPNEDHAKLKLQAPQTTIKITKKLPKFVILSASTPRSGSTLSSYLLRSAGEATRYFHEPDYRYSFIMKQCLKVPECISNYLVYISECMRDKEILGAYKDEPIVLDVGIPVRKACKESGYKVSGLQLFKLVTTPLVSLEPLLNSETRDVKVIHLYRAQETHCRKQTSSSFSNYPLC